MIKEKFNQFFDIAKKNGELADLGLTQEDIKVFNRDFNDEFLKIVNDMDNSLKQTNSDNKFSLKSTYRFDWNNNIKNVMSKLVYKEGESVLVEFIDNCNINSIDKELNINYGSVSKDINILNNNEDKFSGFGNEISKFVENKFKKLCPEGFADKPNNSENNQSTVYNRNEYIIPDSDSRHLEKKDLKYMTKEQLSNARNEIFARHGYVFKDAAYKSYFESKSWYTPDPKYIDDIKKLSECEKYNCMFIESYEKR